MTYPSNMNPGIYDISKGQVELRNDGSFLFLKVEFLPVAPKPKTAKPTPGSLEEIWNKEATLTFAQFRDELDRSGHLIGMKLMLSGRQVMALYEFLRTHDIVKRGLTRVEIFQAFAGSFQLRFKGVTSLHRVVTTRADEEFWSRSFNYTGNGFAFLRSSEQTQPHMVDAVTG